MDRCDLTVLTTQGMGGATPHIRDFDAAALARRSMVVGRHGFGCTAGAGSSCGGSIE